MAQDDESSFLNDSTLNGIITFCEPTCVSECRQIYHIPYKTPQKIFCQFEGKRGELTARLIVDFSKTHRVEKLLPNVKYVEAKDYERCLKLECGGKLYTFETSGEDYNVSLKDFFYHLTNDDAVFVTSVELGMDVWGRLNWLYLSQGEEGFSLNYNMPSFGIYKTDAIKQELKKVDVTATDNCMFGLLKAVLE